MSVILTICVAVPFTAVIVWMVADLVMHDEQRTRCAFIEKLREEYGAGVTILCDNEEPETAEESTGVDVFGSFTNWEDKRFYGKTINDALRKAVMEKIRFENFASERS